VAGDAVRSALTELGMESFMNEADVDESQSENKSTVQQDVTMDEVIAAAGDKPDSVVAKGLLVTNSNKDKPLLSGQTVYCGDIALRESLEGPAKEMESGTGSEMLADLQYRNADVFDRSINLVASYLVRRAAAEAWRDEAGGTFCVCPQDCVKIIIKDVCCLSFVFNLRAVA